MCIYGYRALLRGVIISDFFLAMLVKRSWRKIPGTTISGRTLLKSVDGVTPDDCKVYCENNEKCKSIEVSANVDKGKCDLVGVSGPEAQKKWVTSSKYDYYDFTRKLLSP